MGSQGAQGWRQEMAEDGLPASFIKKLVKAKLAELGGSDKGEVALQKEAVAAFGEAAKIFIHYLTFTANEFCHEAKRSTINAEDVLKAVEEIEFSEFLEPLRESLAGARLLSCGLSHTGLAKALLLLHPCSHPGRLQGGRG